RSTAESGTLKASNIDTASLCIHTENLGINAEPQKLARALDPDRSTDKANLIKHSLRDHPHWIHYLNYSACPKRPVIWVSYMSIAHPLSSGEPATYERLTSGSSLPRAAVLPLLLITLLACLVLFYKLGAYPLFNPDEGYYAEPAREMLDTGEF